VLKPIDKIETAAQSIARSLEIVVLAMDGLFETVLRDKPTVQGLRQFFAAAESVMQQSLDNVVTKLEVTYDELETSLSDSERNYLAEHDSHVETSQDASDAFWGAFTQVRAAYAKRFRDIIAARSFGTDTYKADPKVMTRAGHRWNFTDYTYLTARKMLVDWYNTVKIGYIASLGMDKFMLDSDDPEYADKVYDVDQYPDLVEELFHPRTSKLVGGAYVST
jgi:hypothetical protein